MSRRVAIAARTFASYVSRTASGRLPGAGGAGDAVRSPNRSNCLASMALIDRLARRMTNAVPFEKEESTSSRSENMTHPDRVGAVDIPCDTRLRRDEFRFSSPKWRLLRSRRGHTWSRVTDRLQDIVGQISNIFNGRELALFRHSEIWGIGERPPASSRERRSCC